MTDSESKQSTDTGGGVRSAIVPAFVRRSFVRKFVLTLLIVLLVVGSVSAYAYAQTNNHLAADARTEYTGIAERDAGDITAWQEERAINVQTVSEYDLLRTGDDEEVSQFLDGEAERLPDDVESIHYVDLDRQVITASSDDAREGTQLNTREAPWARGEFELAEDDAYTSQVIEVHGRPTVSFVSPIRGTDGNHALLITSNLDNVVEGFSSPSEDSFTQVVNGDGDVVAGEQDQTELQRNLGSFEPYASADAELTFLERALDGETGFIDGTEKEGLEREFVTAYAPVRTDGEIDMVVAVHVPTDHAYALQSDIMTSMLALVLATFVGFGFIAVTFGRGTVRSINRLSTKAKALEEGNLDEEFEVNRTDEIGNLFRAFASMRDALREQIQEAEDAQSWAEDAKAEAERINRHLETKADEYSEVMQTAADGDLTQRMDPTSTNDAMTEIATEFNAMLAEIETTVDGLKTFAIEVATASEQVTASSEEVRGASQQVSESIQEISDGADRQNEALQLANAQLNDLSTSVDKIAASSTDVAEIAERTAKTGHEGQSAAQNAIEGMRQTEHESEGTVEAMERLQQEIAQIDDLLEFITDIASQTNMLALNANIEASRSTAGDDHDGFGAVATEIKELAMETKEAAQDIEDRLERIKAETDRTATEVQTTRSQISRQTASVKEAANALEEIAEYAQETNAGVQQIDTSTQEQAEATSRVVSVIDETATISEEMTAESENVAAAAEEQTTALTEMSRSASDLTERASKLSTALDRFGTDVDGERDSMLDGIADGDPSAGVTAGSRPAASTDAPSATDDGRSDADEPSSPEEADRNHAVAPDDRSTEADEPFSFVEDAEAPESNTD